MRNGLLFLFISTFSLSLFAQEDYRKHINKGQIAHWSINISQLANEPIDFAQAQPAPVPKIKYPHNKAIVNQRHAKALQQANKTNYLQSSSDINPGLNRNFNGMDRPAGIPNDNHMAISNNGDVVSVTNSWVAMYSADGNKKGTTLTLSAIVKGKLGSLDRTYDPKVLYDPTADRFILVFLQGSLSTTTKIVIGFSTESDPTGKWNFYALDGNPFSNGTWSDYPIIAHNKTSVYLTFNLLLDNTDWRDGFTQSVIWQVGKAEGFAGQNNLSTVLYDNLKFNNKSLWSICPVQEGGIPANEDMYFLTVRPSDLSNDSVFLHHIDGVNGNWSVMQLTTDQPYGLPPNGYQPKADYKLQSNDARVLSGIRLNNTIHYAQSTVTPIQSAGIYHGIISDINGMPQIQGDYIVSDTLDFAYPSMAWAGTTAGSNAIAITFSHSGTMDYPGTSAVLYNQLSGGERLYSEVIKVKEGNGVIDTQLPDSIERWGDYTGIQRKYNEPGKVWLCGSYGDSTNDRNETWIAELSTSDELQFESVISANHLVYPNPSLGMFTVYFKQADSQKLNIQLTDRAGKVIGEYGYTEVNSGQYEVNLDLQQFPNGLYFLRVLDDKQELVYSQKIIKQDGQ